MRQGLQERASQRQACADQHGHQAARQSEVLHQRLCKRRRLARQQGAKGVAPRNRNGRVAKKTQPEDNDKRDGG